MTRGKSDVVVEAFKEDAPNGSFRSILLLLPDDDFVEHSNGRIGRQVQAEFRGFGERVKVVDFTPYLRSCPSASVASSLHANPDRTGGL